MSNLLPAQRRHLSRSISNVLRSIMAVRADGENPHSACGYFGTCGDPAHVLFSYIIPAMPIEDYIARLMTYMQCDEVVFRTATAYVTRLATPGLSILTPWSIHRIFLGAAIIASKFCDDAPKHMHLFASCGGIELRETCTVERVLLNLLRFEVFVSCEQYREINKCIDAGFVFSRPGNLLLPLLEGRHRLGIAANSSLEGEGVSSPPRAAQPGSPWTSPASGGMTQCRRLAGSNTLSYSSSYGALSATDEEGDEEGIEVVCA
jgi:hypothetical protein